MSNLPLVFFDASLRNGEVGVGIFIRGKNLRLKKKIAFKNKEIKSSTLAERIALVQTIHFLQENNITSAHLFTDNKCLANLGISEKLAKRFEKISLNWIPRELNGEADKLSKDAFIEENINISPKKLSLEKYKKTLSFERRIKILKVLSKKPSQIDLIKGKIEKLCFGKKDILFFQAVKKLFDLEEFEQFNSSNFIQKHIKISNRKLNSDFNIEDAIINCLKSKITK